MARRKREPLSPGPSGLPSTHEAPALTGRRPADDRAAALLHQIAEGDRAALGELYDGYAPVVLAVAYRVLGSQREAEDLVHDVFLEVWQRAGDYDQQRASVRTWLLLRVRSRALDRMRRSHRAGKAALDVAWLKATEAQLDPAVARDGQRLHGIVLDLPAEQRAVLELGYFAGYSSAEIARELAIPIGTVKSRMARAIALLRLRLRDYHGTDS
jgi:RNA polymerase sigma-70 factor (ECF subfamily)